MLSTRYRTSPENSLFFRVLYPLFNFPLSYIFSLCKSKRYESPFIILLSFKIYLPSIHGTKYRTFAYSPVLYYIKGNCIKFTKSWFSLLILIFMSSNKVFVRLLTETVWMGYRMSPQVFSPGLGKLWHTDRHTHTQTINGFLYIDIYRKNTKAH